MAVPDGQDTGARQFGEPPATRGRWLSRRPLVRTGVRRTVRHPIEPNQLPSVGIKTRMKLPGAAGRPSGASIVVVALVVSDGDRLSPVALSKWNHEAR